MARDNTLNLGLIRRTTIATALAANRAATAHLLHKAVLTNTAPCATLSGTERFLATIALSLCFIIHKASDGNRTHNTNLEGWRVTNYTTNASAGSGTRTARPPTLRSALYNL